MPSRHRSRSGSRSRSRKSQVGTRKHKGGSHLTQKSFDMIVKKMLELTILIRLYHWNTFSYATHKATDDLNGSISGHIDTYVETMLGKSDGKYRINMNDFKSLSVKGVSNNSEMTTKVKQFISEFSKFNLALKGDYNDVLNIRDEIVGDLNKFLYLLSLK
jgi:hypothetical protein